MHVISCFRQKSRLTILTSDSFIAQRKKKDQPQNGFKIDKGDKDLFHDKKYESLRERFSLSLSWICEQTGTQARTARPPWQLSVLVSRNS